MKKSAKLFKTLQIALSFGPTNLNGDLVESCNINTSSRKIYSYVGLCTKQAGFVCPTKLGTKPLLC